jgi:molybdenum cofactor cytidylyltransferase
VSAVGALRVTAVVLAAGASRRTTARGAPPKQLLDWEGEPLVRRAVRAALASRCAAVHVVVGARAPQVRAALAGLGAEVVGCADWEEGMAASIRAGVASAARSGCDAVLLALADQPRVEPAHLDALVARLEAGASVAASAYAGTLGAPAAFARAHFGELLALRGDRGAKALLERHRAAVAAVPCDAAAFDVDEPGAGAP